MVEVAIIIIPMRNSGVLQQTNGEAVEPEGSVYVARVRGEYVKTLHAFTDLHVRVVVV